MTTVIRAPLRPEPGRRGAEQIPLAVWLFTAGLVASMFSGFSAYLGLPLGVDRPLLLMGLILLLVDPATERVRFRPVHLVMLLTLGWTLWSWVATGSLTDTYKAFAYVDRLVVPFMMFCVGPLMYCTTRRRDLLVKTLVVMSFYLAWTGIAQIANQPGWVWPAYAGDLSVGINPGRGRGPFGGSEPYGMVGTLCLAAGCVGIVRFRGIWRFASGVATIAGAVCTILSLTRSAWLGAILAFLVCGLMAPVLRRWLPLVAAGVAVVIALALAAIPALAATMSDRLQTEGSLYDRVNTNAAALRIIEQEPFFGIGWANFLSLNERWIWQGDLYPLTNTNIEVHNVFLARAAETGWLGTVLWVLAMLLGPLAVLWLRPLSTEFQAWRLFAVAAFFVWLVPSFFSPNSYPLANNLVWLIGGIACRPLLVRIGGDVLTESEEPAHAR